MKKVSKKTQVLAHLKQFGNITSWQAIQTFRATRLSDIIFRLKDEGHNIITEMETDPSSGIRFARYHYIDGGSDGTRTAT